MSGGENWLAFRLYAEKNIVDRLQRRGFSDEANSFQITTILTSQVLLLIFFQNVDVAIFYALTRSEFFGIDVAQEFISLDVEDMREICFDLILAANTWMHIRKEFLKESTGKTHQSHDSEGDFGVGEEEIQYYFFLNHFANTIFKVICLLILS